MKQTLGNCYVKVYIEDAGKCAKVNSRKVDKIVAEVELSYAECENVVEGMSCILCLAGWVLLEQGQNLLHFIIGEIMPHHKSIKVISIKPLKCEHQADEILFGLTIQLQDY